MKLRVVFELILLSEKFLQSSLLRAVVFQLYLKCLVRLRHIYRVSDKYQTLKFFFSQNHDNILIITNFYIFTSGSINCSHHGETNFIEFLFRKHEVSPVYKQYLLVFLLRIIVGSACVLLEQFLFPKQARWFGKFMLNARVGCAEPC